MPPLKSAWFRVMKGAAESGNGDRDMTYEEAAATAADRITRAFYTIAQHMIGEDDGGVADMVEEKLDFLGGVARPMVADLADAVGVNAVLERTECLDDDTLVAAIEPICGPGEQFSHADADQAAAETSTILQAKVVSLFPEIGAGGTVSLGGHTDRAFEISKSHLRSEANFREAYPAASPQA